MYYYYYYYYYYATVCKLVIKFLCRNRYKVKCNNERNEAKYSKSNANDRYLVYLRNVVRFPVEEKVLSSPKRPGRF